MKSQKFNQSTRKSNTDRRTFLKRFAGSAIAAGFINSRILAELPKLLQQKKLNVLFIMSDQHSAHALGCYGNKEIKTPNLDRLANEGVLFENAFCQTGQCCPSRYSAWTGKYARSHGCYANGQMEDASETTFAEIYKAAGYATESIGKHHMHMHLTPNKHGFDKVIDFNDFAQFIKDEKAKNFAVDGKWLPVSEVHPGSAYVGESDADNDHHPAGFWTQKAIEFIRENQEQPFCLWYSFYGPHTPIITSRPWANMYDPQKLTLPPNNKYDFDYKVPGLDWMQAKNGNFTEELHRKTLAYYYGLVSQIDYNIGRVLDELDKLGLSKNTIVVYTADHGEMMSEHGAWTKGLQGYDATLRVPLIMRLPNSIPAGKRIKKLSCTIDILPTLLDLTDSKSPEGVQGKNLMPLINDKSVEWRDVVFSEIGDPDKDVTLTARTLDSKYVLYRAKDGKVIYEQLFDVEKDPWEMKNQIDNPEYKAKKEKMKAYLKEWENNTPSKTPGEKVVPIEQDRVKLDIHEGAKGLKRKAKDQLDTERVRKRKAKQK